MSDYLWNFENASRSRVGPSCDVCDRIHSSVDVYAIDRFMPRGVSGYRAHVAGEFRGPSRETRNEAMKDVCNYYATNRAATEPSEGTTR